MWQYQQTSELYHYGILGMKWGKRIARGHAGPGIGLTQNRQSNINKKDLETLNNGGHLSVGVTKSRQAAYDKRDKENIKKREEHKQFRADVKQAKRHGLAYDAFGDTTTFNNTALDQFYNSKNQKIGQEYAMKVTTRAKKEQLVTEMAVTAMAIVGANYASHKLGLH